MLSVHCIVLPLLAAGWGLTVLQGVLYLPGSNKRAEQAAFLVFGRIVVVFL